MGAFDMHQVGDALEQLHGLPSDQLPVLLHSGYVPTAELEAWAAPRPSLQFRAADPAGLGRGPTCQSRPGSDQLLSRQ